MSRAIRRLIHAPSFDAKERQEHLPWPFNRANYQGSVPTRYTLQYLIVGWENRPMMAGGAGTGTPHLQFYFELYGQTKVRLHQLKAWFPRAHVEPRYGTPTEAAEYCKKEGMWREWGERSDRVRDSV